METDRDSKQPAPANRRPRIILDEQQLLIFDCSQVPVEIQDHSGNLLGRLFAVHYRGDEWLHPWRDWEMLLLEMEMEMKEAEEREGGPPPRDVFHRLSAASSHPWPERNNCAAMETSPWVNHWLDWYECEEDENSPRSSVHHG